jgi:hypothetical protein
MTYREGSSLESCPRLLGPGDIVSAPRWERATVEQHVSWKNAVDRIKKLLEE